MNRRTRLARSRDQRRKRRQTWGGTYDAWAERVISAWGPLHPWSHDGPGMIIDSTGVYTRWSGQKEWRDGFGNVAKFPVVRLNLETGEWSQLPAESS